MRTVVVARPKPIYTHRNFHVCDAYVGNVGGISNVPTVSVLCDEAKTITVGIQIVIF